MTPKRPSTDPANRSYQRDYRNAGRLRRGSEGTEERAVGLRRALKEETGKCIAYGNVPLVDMPVPHDTLLYSVAQGVAQHRFVVPGVAAYKL